MLSKITITDNHHGVGDLNALIGDRVVAVAFAREGKWRIYDIIRGGGPIALALTKPEARRVLAQVAKVSSGQYSPTK